MTVVNVKEAINLRRAYRSFDSIEIHDELITDLAECAQVAPSCMNKQPWNFIFVRKPSQLEKIFQTLTPANVWVRRASLVIVVFGAKEDDCVLGPDGQRLYYLFDIGLAVENMILRATELGLVAHPIAGFNPEEVQKALGIPEEYLVVTLVNVGKHSEEINPDLSDNMKLGEKQRPPRKKIESFIHIDAYSAD